MSKQDSFRYTSLCRFFLAGRCERGEDCHFAHDESQLREKPNLYKTRICRSLQKSGQCKEGPGCRFAHGQDEVRDYSSGASAAESVEGDGWARTESSWSQEEEGDMKNGYVAVPWVDQGMGYCPAMWPGYGFPVMGWMPSGEMAWIPCQWEEQETAKCKEHDADTVEPSADVTHPCTVEGVLEWDPMNLSKPEGKDFACDLNWDPLGLGVCSSSEGTAVACLDPSVVLLAARTLDKKSSTVDAVKRASFYSLPSTEFSEKTEKDDETDSVFEAWAANGEGRDSPDDIIMHKGVHYEMSVRNTFISFGVAGAAKRMLQRSLSEPSLNERDE